MCTTFLATEIIKESGLDLIGYPRLVRLNPNIGYKTRGNGAVVLRLGKGRGQHTVAGSTDGRQLLSFSSEEGEQERADLLELTRSLISEYAEMDCSNTNPGMVVSSSPLPVDLYGMAVRKEITMEDALKVLKKGGAMYSGFKNRRGIIGAASALSWSGKRRTFEALAYKFPRPMDMPAELKMDAARALELGFPDTFNNIDERNLHPAIFPSAKTPVLYGIRGLEPANLLKAVDLLDVEFGIRGERHIIFETNQATDDHIISDPGEMAPLSSYSVSGEITGMPFSIRGGHVFARMRWMAGSVLIAAFEPTKEFRGFVKNLRPGDRIRAWGSYDRGTLKLEKAELFTVARYFRRGQPFCDGCGKLMKTHGRNDFRCSTCGSRKRMPEYREEARSVLPGKEEVPVCARRHLSMPIKLERQLSAGEQSVAEGVNP